MPHFDEALTILRDRATDLSAKGRSFEHLMKAALSRQSSIKASNIEVGLGEGFELRRCTGGYHGSTTQSP